MIKRTCPVCDCLYEANEQRLKHNRETTCSRTCSYKDRAQRNTKKQILTCATCANSFARLRKKNRHGLDFCSPACHYQGRTLGLIPRIVVRKYKITEENRLKFREHMLSVLQKRRETGYQHTEATRLKMSNSHIRRISEGKTVRVSKLETQIGEDLKYLGVETHPQFGIRNPKGCYVAVIDFWLPQYNIAIEVNGSFWHTDPRVYPKGATCATQKHNLLKYEAKKEKLAFLGIPLLEIWELDYREKGFSLIENLVGLIREGGYTLLLQNRLCDLKSY